jgi:DNA repair exonuclease SbcCD ATPase subunit
MQKLEVVGLISEHSARHLDTTQGGRLSPSSAVLQSSDLENLEEDTHWKPSQLDELSKRLEKQLSKAVISYRNASSNLIRSENFHQLKGSLYPTVNKPVKKIYTDDGVMKRIQRRKVAELSRKMMELKEKHERSREILQEKIDELEEVEKERKLLKSALTKANDVLDQAIRNKKKAMNSTCCSCEIL